MLPFVNNLWTTSLTGAQFKTLLEQQWQTNPDGTVPSRAYLQLGLSKNVNYTYDAARAAGDRITSIRVNGSLIDPVVGKDALSDLAVLTIDAKYADTSLEFGDSDKLRAGDDVIAIGNPLGLDFSGTVTQGIVSAVNRSINVKTSAGEWEMNVIQTDAAINPGNSGGALLNAAGQVIGINSLKISESGVEGLGFAIPSNEVVPLIEEMTANGQVERPYIGIGLADLDQVPRTYLQGLPNEVTAGVVITNIDPASAAGKAGLDVEDIITAINGTEVKNSTELRKFLYSNLLSVTKQHLRFIAAQS